MTKTEREDRTRAAYEVASELLEAVGCETDCSVPSDARHMSGGSVWITVRVMVPDLNIEERLAKEGGHGAR